MLYEKKALHTAKLSVSWAGAVAFTDRPHIELPEALDFTYNGQTVAG